MELSFWQIVAAAPIERPASIHRTIENFLEPTQILEVSPPVSSSRGRAVVFSLLKKVEKVTAEGVTPMSLPMVKREEIRNFAFVAFSLIPLLLGFGSIAFSDQPQRAILHPAANANFKSTGDPACLASAVEAGNPSTGPSTILLKASRTCVVQWHFHLAEEQLMVIKGELKMEMTSMPATVLGPGGFALIPSKEKHQFTCSHKSDCLVFLTIDRAFDSTWAKPGAQ
jgi:quercetin dioxygenase-like cupin family protein